MSNTDRPGALLTGRLRRRVQCLVLCGLCTTWTVAQAQFMMPGTSPWSGLGNPLGQAGLPAMSSPYPGMPMPGMSPWSGLGSPFGQPGFPGMSSPYPAMSVPGVSPWSGLGNPFGQPGLPAMSPAYPGMSPPGGSPWSGIGSPFGQPGFPAISPMYPGAPQGFAGSADSYQPDLTGNWRGSGGERVQIQRNRARIWGGSGSYQSCTCVFFLVGQRLIAFSPESDTVRKYWFKQVSRDRFALVDDAGNLMTFWRVR